MTTAYSNALTEVRNATAKFMAITADYRALKIDDATFLAARAEYKAAEAIFDKAAR